MNDQLKHLELYYVSWFDPTTHASWCSYKEASCVQPTISLTVGWLVNRDEHCIRLAMHYNADDDWADVFPIPVGCLVGEPQKVSDITLCQITPNVPAETA